MAIRITIGNVPSEWANGQPVTREDRLAIALLRQAGCTCEMPLLRFARDENWNLNDGPRCKVCNTNIILVSPTAEETLAYKRQSHQTALWYDRNHPGAFAAIGWKSECFTGCGCDSLSPEVVPRRDATQQDQQPDGTDQDRDGMLDGDVPDPHERRRDDENDTDESSQCGIAFP